MIRKLFIILLLQVLSMMALAQKTFNVTIQLDKSINPRKFECQYNNGKAVIFVPDTAVNQRTIILKDEFFSRFASFSMGYTDTDGMYKQDSFFVGDKPQELHFFLSLVTMN